MEIKLCLHYTRTVGVFVMPIPPENGRLQTPILRGARRMTMFHGACYATRREVLETVGMHDSDCDFGGEELDFS